MRLAAITLAACVGSTSPVYRPDVVRIVQTDSDKAVQVVADERMSAHEARTVPASAVAAALIASGMFLEDDARLLAGPVASHLATMHPEESVRIIGWAADAPRYYYVLVHDQRLQITYYAGNTRSDDYSGVIPTEAVAITAPPEPVNEAPPTEPAPVAVPPDAGASQVVAVQPRSAPPPRKQRRVAAGYEPLTEAEARRRIRELDEAMRDGLITQREHRTQRKNVLARL